MHLFVNAGKKLKGHKLPLVFIVICSILLITLLSGCQKSQSQTILEKTVKKINGLINKRNILFESYDLSFNDSSLNQNRSFYEDYAGNIKIISPHLTALRKNAGNHYLFLGHDTKNHFYDEFKIGKKYFENNRRKANAAVLTNSFISRGVTMYSAYGPKQFWEKLVKSMIAAGDFQLTKNKQTFEIFSKADKHNNVVISIDQKTFLPVQLKIQAKDNKVWHEDWTFKTLTLKVVKREFRPAQEGKQIFKIELPSNYKSRTIIIKKHSEEEKDQEGSNVDEAVCDSCHFKDFKIIRSEK